jgi:hypothetical protein
MSTDSRKPLSLLDEILCTAAAVGLVLVALLPAARGMSAIGWLPMWLVAMPALAWWALHRFAVPARGGTAAAGPHRAAAMRRATPQARRAPRALRRTEARRAA